ncbi:MAG: hypothetical protein V1717_00830 [Candidatus Micrarchaeota archaeon]
MDFTFLFVIVIMLLAVKSGLVWVAAGLALILLATSKSNYLIFAAVVGIAVVVAVNYLGDSDLSFWVIVGGLGLILLLLAKKDSDQPTPQFYSQ